jgi:YVTN family beta-propeller protein
MSKWIADRVHVALTARGYGVFLDSRDMRSGRLNEILELEVATRDCFVVVLTHGSFDRIDEPGDWMRLEIRAALTHGRTIVPLLIDDFDLTRRTLPRDIAALTNRVGLQITVDGFDATIETLCARYLVRPPRPLPLVRSAPTPPAEPAVSSPLAPPTEADPSIEAPVPAAQTSATPVGTAQIHLQLPAWLPRAGAVVGAVVLVAVVAVVLSHLGRWPVAVGAGASAVALSPEGDTAYVVHADSDAISPVDTDFRMVGDPLNGGQGGQDAVVAPDSKSLFVTNPAACAVSIVDIDRFSPIFLVSLNAEPHGLALSPDGRQLYVPLWQADRLAVIDTTTRQVTARIPVGSSPQAVAVAADGARVFVANTADATISVIDATTNGVVATLPAGPSPTAVASWGDDTVLVTNRDTNTLSLVGIDDSAKNRTYPVGQAPEDVVLGPSRRTAFVAGADGVTVVQLRESDVRPIDVEGGPVDLAEGPRSVLVLGDSYLDAVGETAREAGDIPWQM